jgi:hypothetical protein
VIAPGVFERVLGENLNTASPLNGERIGCELQAVNNTAAVLIMKEL